MANKRRKIARIIKKKRAARNIGLALILIGLVALIGTAGASDVGTFSLVETIKSGLLSMTAIGVGMGVRYRGL